VLDVNAIQPRVLAAIPNSDSKHPHVENTCVGRFAIEGRLE